jgi:hypothetical protein
VAAGIEEMFGRVVDVQEYGIKLARRVGRVEARACKLEKIALASARIEGRGLTYRLYI